MLSGVVVGINLYMTYLFAAENINNNWFYIPVVAFVLVWLCFYAMIAYFAAGFTFMDRSVNMNTVLSISQVHEGPAAVATADAWVGGWVKKGHDKLSCIPSATSVQGLSARSLAHLAIEQGEGKDGRNWYQSFLITITLKTCLCEVPFVF